MSSKALILKVENKVGATLLPDNAQWTNRMQIRSESSDRLYTVAQRKSDGTIGCDCMGWIRHRTCKHTKVIAPLLAQMTTLKGIN
jgi:hypothetical protein